MTDQKKLDAVFEGGGVKGIGLVGAVEVVERQGYAFENVAGTSAGAIVAALVAAGYRAGELREIMRTLNYGRFLDRGALDNIPLLGPALSLGLEKGIYEGKYLTDWLGRQLAAKRVRTFGDLVSSDPECARDPRWRYRLQVIATDLTRGRLVVLPRDAREYGLDPDALEVAAAVRMSMSIPFFFEPVRLGSGNQQSYIVDGGVLSSFPVWLFDSDAEPAWPTFGFKLVDPSEGKHHEINGPLSMFGALFTTMMEAHDARYIEDASYVRTIGIPTTGVQSTDFDLSGARADRLYQSGVKAAERFFEKWSFEAYKAEFRSNKARPSRSERLSQPGR
jgi:NTE family protein